MVAAAVTPAKDAGVVKQGDNVAAASWLAQVWTRLRANLVLVPATLIFVVSATIGSELGHQLELHAPIVQTALVGTVVFFVAHLLLGPRIAAHALCCSFVLFNAVILLTAIFGSATVLNTYMVTVNLKASSIATTAACMGVLFGIVPSLRPKLRLLTVSAGMALGACNACIRLARTGNPLAVWNFSRAFLPFLVTFNIATMGRLPSATSLTIAQLLLVYDVVLTECMAWSSTCSVALIRFACNLLFIPHVPHGG